MALVYGTTNGYKYDLSAQPGGTLNFVHTHAHGLVAEQYWGGLMIPLIVDDPDDITALRDFETHTLVLKDITLSGNQPELYTSTMDFMHGKEGNIIMVNGQVNPVLDIRPGQIQRWQILNGSNARYYKLTGGDASYASLYTSIPAWKDVVNIPKWGRATILVPVTDWPGMTMFHCHIVEHEDIGMMGMWHIMEPMPMP